MRKGSIKAGKTYVGSNGKCMTVVGIRNEYRPTWVEKPEPGVLYRSEKNGYGRMYLSDFAKWARRRYG